MRFLASKDRHAQKLLESLYGVSVANLGSPKLRKVYTVESSLESTQKLYYLIKYIVAFCFLGLFLSPYRT